MSCTGTGPKETQSAQGPWRSLSSSLASQKQHCPQEVLLTPHLGPHHLDLAPLPWYLKDGQEVTPLFATLREGSVPAC